MLLVWFSSRNRNIRRLADAAFGEMSRQRAGDFGCSQREQRLESPTGQIASREGIPHPSAFAWRNEYSRNRRENESDRRSPPRDHERIAIANRYRTPPTTLRHLPTKDPRCSQCRSLLFPTSNHFFAIDGIPTRQRLLNGIDAPLTCRGDRCAQVKDAAFRSKQNAVAVRTRIQIFIDSTSIDNWLSKTHIKCLSSIKSVFD